MNQTDQQHNKSNRKKLVRPAVLMVLAIAAFLLINPLTGNPISKLFVEHNAKAYIAEQYSTLDLELDRVGYNFKNGCYYAHVTSQGNVDIHFEVSANGWGKILSDDYESQVISGWNTAMRLDEEYRDLADTVLESDAFPYVCDIGFGELLFEDFSVPAGSENGLSIADLELGKEYDILSLAKNSGKLTIYIDSDTVTVENAAKVLLEIRTRMDSAGVAFHFIDFTLQYPRPKDESARPDGSVMVLDFLYTDIYDEGMVDRVRTAYEAALAYYSEQDALKTGEPSEL